MSVLVYMIPLAATRQYSLRGTIYENLIINFEENGKNE